MSDLHECLSPPYTILQSIYMSSGMAHVDNAETCCAPATSAAKSQRLS